MAVYSGVDWSNPLSRDLVAAFLPTTGQPINLVSGSPTTRSTGDLTRRSTENGTAWYVTRAEDVVIATDVQPVLGPDHTMLALAAHREGVYATSQFYLSARIAENKGFAFYISHPGGDYRKIGYVHGGVAARDSADIIWPLNTWSAVAVTSSTAAGNVNFYFKGSLVNTTTIGAMIPTADKVHIGNDIFFTGDFGLGADVAVILYWRRRLSDAEMAAISADPFQLFRPAARRFAFEVADGGGPVAYEDSFSLGISSGLAGTGSASASAALAIGTRAGTGLNPQAAASGALALGMQSGLSSSGAASVSGAIGLAFDAGLGLGGQASAADLATLALGFGLGIGTGGAFTDSLTLGIASGLSNTGSAGAAAGLSIGTAAGLSASGLATALSALSLGVGIGISNSDGATQHYSDGIQLSQGLALQAASVAQGSDAITLSYTTRVEVAGQGAAVAVISLDLSAGLQQQATANVMDAISIGAAIGQAIAAVMGGLVPPASRTFTVGSDDRTIRISIDLRRYDA